MERYAAVFEAADPPRTSTVAFYPAQDPPPADGAAGAPGPDRLTVATPAGTRETVPALRLPVSEAIPLLSRARRTGDAH
ncbi:MAG: hypothetical protein HOQ46_17640, partial [Saccharothrix sp.]|nr:hypothetical protein [Saccharothrix sp.]